MNYKYDVIALGELLVDFTPSGKSEQGNQIFEACPGGAPCNVLSMLQKLGRRTAFIGRVGADQFGELLRHTIEEIGIDSSCLNTDCHTNTTLTFVHKMPDGDREFSFYRNPGADMMLNTDDIKEEFIRQGRIFHYGTLSMTDSPGKEATEKAIDYAEKNHMLISFDPNLRLPLWKTSAAAKERMEYGFKHCDVLKIADNEICFVTGLEDYDQGIRKLQENYHIPLILLTLGKEGSRAYYKNMTIDKKAFFQKHPVDTTGAGDTFCGCILEYLLEHDINTLSEADLEEMLTFANAAASLITTKKGAIRSMPDRQEIIQIIHG